MLTPKEIGSGKTAVFPYSIEHSMLMDGTADVLHWTPQIAGSSTTFTVHLGVKFQEVTPGSTDRLFNAGNSGSNYFSIDRRTDNKLQVVSTVGGVVKMQWLSDAEFVDITGHGYLTVAVDTTAGDGPSRLKVQWNGGQLAGNVIVEAEKGVSLIANSVVKHNVGGLFDSPGFAGYISDFHLLDGIAADASSFGKMSNRCTGVYAPRPYDGDYGLNGKHLEFGNAASMGDDSSGHNLLLYSQDASRWSMPNMTVVVDDTTAPDGTMTGDKLIAAESGWPSSAQTNILITAGAQMVNSRYFKAGTTDDVHLFIGNASLSSNGHAQFNVATGTVVMTGGTANDIRAGVQDVGNGWYRCWISCRLDPSITAIRCDAAPQGAGLTMFMWGGQLEYGDMPGTYKPTASNTYSGAGAIGAPRQTLDTPTNNFCTLNPLVGLGLDVSAPAIYGSGNLEVTGGNEALTTRAIHGTLSTDQPLYYESVYEGSSGVLGRWAVGIIDGHHSPTHLAGIDTHSIAYRDCGDILFDGNSVVTGLGTPPAKATVQLAYAPSSGKLWIGWNGTWLNSGNPSTGENPIYTQTVGNQVIPAITAARPGDAHTLHFGATGFDHTPPDGFMPVCSRNLSEPVVAKSSRVVDLMLRNGTGADVSLAELGFSPDFVNIKDRDDSYAWVLHDSVRGATKCLAINKELAEVTEATSLTSFDSRGYSLGAYAPANISGDRFIDLCLQAGSEQGFEIVTYTGDGQSGRWIPHSLGKAPTFMMVKSLSSDNAWIMYHAALGGTKYLTMDTEAAGTSVTIWHNTDPSATGFRVSYGATNLTGEEYVAYLFTDSDIFRAFSYVGSGLEDGPYVHLGGRPLSIPFWKNSDTASYQWYNIDSARTPHNPIDLYQHPSAPNSEAVWDYGEFLSQGFKVTTTGSGVNEADKLFVGLAILESNQKYSNAY